MPHRHEITDVQWELLQPLLRTEPTTKGRPRRDPRVLLNGVLWLLRTGAPWRDLPERYGPWQTVYHHFNRWRSDGTLDRILTQLQIRLDREGKIDWDLFCIDGTNVRASRAASGASKKAPSDMTTNLPTTLWAAREADSAANSTWLLTAKAFRSRRK